MANAIFGTLVLTGLASVVAVPIGILGGVYLAEYAGAWFAASARFTASTMDGMMSMVIGVLGDGIVVLPFKEFGAFPRLALIIAIILVCGLIARFATRRFEAMRAR